MALSLSLPQKALANALDPVRRVVARQNTIPILSNVRIVAEIATDDAPATVRLTGTDLDREVTVTTPAEVSQPGETTVPAGLLLDIVRKLPSVAEVALTVDDEGRQMTVASGRSKFRLQCLPASDFPDLERRPATHAFMLAYTQIRHLFGRVAFAMSKEETRYYLCGAFLHVADETGLLTGVGTCGHRLAIAEMVAPKGSVGMPGVIVPSGTVDEILRLVGKVEGVVDVRVSSHGIVFTIGSVELLSKLIDGSYPDYRRLVPSENPHRLSVDRAALAGAVDRVETVSSERGYGMRVALAASEITLYVRQDAGSATETVEATFEGAPFEIGFNSRYLAGILGGMDAERIELALRDPGSPTLITGDRGVSVVLMPQRI